MPQSTGIERLFLDTNVLVAGSFALQPDHKVVFNYQADKYTNEYVIKEYRHVLAKQGVLPHDIENVLEEMNVLEEIRKTSKYCLAPKNMNLKRSS